MFNLPFSSTETADLIRIRLLEQEMGHFLTIKIIQSFLKWLLALLLEVHFMLQEHGVYSQSLNVFIISTQLIATRTKQDLSKVIIVLSLIVHKSIWEA